MTMEVAIAEWNGAQGSVQSLIAAQAVSSDPMAMEAQVADAISGANIAAISVAKLRAHSPSDIALKMQVAMMIAATDGDLDEEGPAMSLLSSIKEDLEALVSSCAAREVQAA